MRLSAVSVKPGRDERGMALIAAVLVTMIVLSLAGIAAQIAMHNLSSSSVALKLVQASNAAEAGIDVTIADIQSGTALPVCGPQSQQALGPPTNSYYTLTITYYDSSGASLCEQSGKAPSATPASALLQSVGTTNATDTFGDATWEAELKLTPSPSTGSGFDQALYSGGSMMFSNSATIFGDGSSNDADVYANGDFKCTNHLTNYGNVYSQGDIESTNQCGSVGNWWANGSICDFGNGTIVGSVTAAGDVSGECNSHTPGTISMGSTVVDQGAVARSTITPWPCGTNPDGTPRDIEGSCTENTDSSSNPGPPPADPFPQWSLNTSTWTSAGYTVIDDTTGTSNPGTACPTSGTGSKVYTDLAAMATAGSPPTLIYTDCQIKWSEGNCLKVSGICTWTFANNVAIVDLGGFNTSGAVSFQSASSTEHDFYMMVPFDQYTGGTNQCVGTSNGSGNISFSNKMATGGTNNADPLALMIYTPCSTTLSNSNNLVGQVYTGANLSVTNAYTMHFQMVPVPGYDTTGSDNPSSSTYTVALLYKRQN